MNAVSQKLEATAGMREPEGVPRPLGLIGLRTLSFGFFGFLSLPVYWSDFSMDWQRSTLVPLLALAFVTALLRPGALLVLHGVVLCSFSLFGSSAIPLWFSVGLLAAAFRPDRHRALGPAERHASLSLLLWSAAVVFPALTPLIRNADLSLLQSVASEAGVGEGLRVFFGMFWETSQPLVRTAFAFLLPPLVLWQWLSLDVSRRDAASKLLLGLGAGALLGSALFLAQYLEVHPFFSVTRSTFWLFVGRYSGSFSDPNAFGLMAGLLLPFLIVSHRERGTWLLRLGGLTLALSALWSGSRSFLLLLVAWALILAGRLIVVQRGRRQASLLLLFFALLICAVVMPLSNAALRQLIPLPSVERGLSSVHWDVVPSLLDSRLVFWRMALHLWQQAPLLGHGLQSFYELQAGAASQLGIALGDWRDNANSFYLQLLAEGGVLSIMLLSLGLALFVPLLRLRSTLSRDAPSELARVALVLVLLLLSIGPHLAFHEVRFLCLILLFFALPISPNAAPAALHSRFAGIAVFLLPLALCAYGLKAVVEPAAYRGFYALESNGIQHLRWTAGRAEFSICPVDDQAVGLRVAAPRPDLPIEIAVYQLSPVTGAEQLIADHLLENGDQTEFLLPGAAVGKRNLRLEVDRLWQPDPEGDRRWLGVQLFLTEEFCGPLE